ncbi:MAG: glycosyltransferase [Gammaproteobacteria bacterium]|nr:glycosyltransferase [Gammaproteobacteria bacterium]
MAEQQSTAPPLVTVGVPLFNSARFLDNIVTNLQGFDYPNLEIILSDDCSTDDCIDILRESFNNDLRVTFFRQQKNLGWIQHYNFILSHAYGKYFMWMPHDDSYPYNYVSRLVGLLEEQPNAVLAFSRMRGFDVDGNPKDMCRWLPSWSENLHWSPFLAVKLLLFWQLWIPFRGVVRRDMIDRANQYIRPTKHSTFADIFWVFSLALRGPFAYVDDLSCVKYRYPGSVSDGCERYGLSLARAVEHRKVLLAYLCASDLSWSSRRLLSFGVHLYMMTELTYRFLPKNFRRRLKDRIRERILSLGVS